MPFTQQLLLKVTALQLFLIVVGFSVVLAIGATFLSVFIFSKVTFRKHESKWRLFVNTGPLLYILLLAVVLISSWQGWKETSLNVRKEANSLIELYRSTEAFLPELRDKLQELLTEYVKSLINDEWNLLSRSQLSPRVTTIAKKMWETYTSYVPRNETEQIFLTESIRKLIELRELRDTRLADSSMGVPLLLWVVLIVGLVITVFTISSIYTDNIKAKLKITIPYAILIGSVCFAILLFDFPFTGAPVVSADPIAQVIARW